MKKIALLILINLVVIPSFCNNQTDSLIRAEFQKIDKKIEKKLNSVDAEVEKIKQAKEKDTWDKVSIVSGFLSSVIIALLGIYFTESYRRIQAEKEAKLNRQELKVKEVETVEKFIPFLTGTEVQQEYAILAIQALGNTDLAIKLTKLYQSKGAVNTLTKIENAVSKEDRTKVQKALSEIFDSLKYSIAKISGKNRSSGNGFYVTSKGHIMTMNYLLNSHPDELEEMQDITIENYGGNISKIEEIRLSEDLGGLGLIYTDNINSTPINISDEDIELNQKIFVSGFSNSRKSMFHYSGEVVGIMEDSFEIIANVGEYRELAGSPVFNSQGQLIGITSTYNTNSQTFGVISTDLINEKIKEIEKR